MIWGKGTGQSGWDNESVDSLMCKAVINLKKRKEKKL